VTYTRRKLIGGLIGAGSALAAGVPLFAKLATPEGDAGDAALCDGAGLTPPQTAGPFFTPGAPARTNLREAGGEGMPLSVDGRVLSRDCRPIGDARVDIWHCDASGSYDNAGYRFRGHMLTDAEGRFLLETIKPAAYGGKRFLRTPHIHVTITPPGASPLTTQLYFPEEPTNARDGLFDPRLLLALSERQGALVGHYRFVLG
jgi:protocatechuate 3,4-dioxygenase beta subunit